MQGLEVIFSQLADLESKIVWIRTPDHNRNIYISSAYEKIWGRKCEELHEYPLSWQENLIGSNKSEIIKELTTRTPKTPQHKNTVYFQIHDTKNTVHWIKDTCFYLFDQVGQQVAVAGVAEEMLQGKWEQEFAVHNKTIMEFDKKSEKDNLLNIINKEFKLFDENLSKFRKKNQDKNIVKESVRLTQREAQCLSYLSNGEPTKKIARELAISPRTVDIHINNLKRKLDCHTRIELISRLNEVVIDVNQ